MKKFIGWIHGIIDGMMFMWMICATCGLYVCLEEVGNKKPKEPHNGHERRVYGNS